MVLNWSVELVHVKIGTKGQYLEEFKASVLKALNNFVNTVKDNVLLCIVILT